MYLEADEQTSCPLLTFLDINHLNLVWQSILEMFSSQIIE